MLKKIFFVVLSLSLLTNCEYRPVYSNQNYVDYKIIITNFTGDKDINNLIATNLKRNSKDKHTTDKQDYVCLFIYIYLFTGAKYITV